MNADDAQRPESSRDSEAVLRTTVLIPHVNGVATPRFAGAAPPRRNAYRGKRRAATALAIAAALHLVALYFLTARQVDVQLTGEQRAQKTTISVSLVAATRAPVAVPAAQTAPALPPRTEPPRQAKVLATHRNSTRTTPQQESVPQTEPASPAPASVAQPAASPAASPSSTSTTPAAAAARADDGKLMSLPKALDASALRQLGCRIPRPAYPSRARRLGESGVVRLRIRIAADGRLSDVQVVQTSGFPDLDTEAVHAVSAGSCEPYRENGIAVAVTAEQPVAFDLDP